MSKIDISTVAQVLKSQQLDPATLRRIIEELNAKIEKLEEGKEEAAPKVKKQWVLMLSDPDGTLPKRDYVGWAIQLPETESVATTQDRLLRATYEFNASKRGRLYPCKTLGEAIENVPAKYFKQADVFPKHKVPVLVLRTDNQVPTVPIAKS